MGKLRFSRRVLPILLSVMILVSSLPLALVHAAPTGDDNLATVEAITEPSKANIGGDQAELSVTYTEKLQLDWCKALPAIGRNEDGWWVGIKLVAPQNANVAQLKNATFKKWSYGESAWSESSHSFWDEQDSVKNEDETQTRFIELWAFVDETILQTEIAAGGSITNKICFDWDNNGEFEQSITFTIDPNEIELYNTVGGNKVQVYPYSTYGTVSVYTEPSAATITGEGTQNDPVTVGYNSPVTLQWSEANPAIGRTIDSWWVGVKFSAPVGRSINSLKNAKMAAQSFSSQEITTYDFWAVQDSDSNSTDTIERYVQYWVPVNPSIIEKANEDYNGVITYSCKFDWDGDGDYEQYFDISLVTSQITLDQTNLKKADHQAPTIGDIAFYDGDTVTTHISNKGSYKVSFKAADERSGLSSWGFATENDESKVSSWSTTFGNEGLCEFNTTEIGESSLINTKYYVFIKDNALPESNTGVYEIDLGSDDAAPVITGATADITAKTNATITYTLTATDNVSEAAAIKFGTAPTDNIIDAKDASITWLEADKLEVNTDQPVYVYAVDETGLNLSAPYTVQAENFHNVANSVKEIKLFLGDDTKWGNADVAVKVIANDALTNASGTKFNTVAYAMDSTETEAWQEDAIFAVTDGAEHVFYIKDEAGNISQASAPYKNSFFDKKAPELDNSESAKAVDFEVKGDSKLAEILNRVTFGKFFNKEWEIGFKTVDKADAANGASGVASLTFITKDTNSVEKSYSTQMNEEGTKATLSLDISELQAFKGSFFVKITDKVGNTETYQLTTDNSNIGEGDFDFVVENEAPVIENVKTKGSLNAEPDSGVFNQGHDFSLLYTVKDKGEVISGLSYVNVSLKNVDEQEVETLTTVFESKISAENTLVETRDFTLDFALLSSKQMRVGEKTCDIDADGIIKMLITAYDNAGNASTMELNVKVDITAPTITKFERVTGETEAIEMSIDAIADTVYAAFYNNTNEKEFVKITAEDDDTYYKSGLKTITYTLYDENGAAIGDPVSVDVSNVNNSATVALDPGFKGYIEAYATDNALNESSKAHTKGIVYETEAQRQATTAIDFANQAGELASETTRSAYAFDTGKVNSDFILKDNVAKSAKTPLYKEATAFTVTVVNTQSGIQEVKAYTLENTDGTVDSNTKALQVKAATWTDGATNHGIVTKKTAQFSFDNLVDSTLVVAITDNAGYTTYDYYTFTVDSSNPTIASVTPNTTDPTNKTITFTVAASDQLTEITAYAMKNTDDVTAIEDEDWIADTVENSNQFNVNDCQEHFIFVKDEAGHISSQRIQALNYNDAYPTITEVTGWSSEWTNHSFIVTVVPKNAQNTANTEFAVTQYQMDGGAWQSEPTFTIADCKEHTFYVKDESNNVSQVAFTQNTLNYDLSAPALAEGQAVKFTQKNEGIIAKVLNKLTFGRYFNKNLVISVDAVDQPAEENEALISNTSGIVEATFKFISAEKDKVLTYTANAIDSKNDKTSISFVLKDGDLPANFKGTAQVVLKDAAGNISTIDLNTDNSNMGQIKATDDYSFMIEKDAPHISKKIQAAPVVTAPRSEKDVPYKETFNEDVLFSFELSDSAQESSGIFAYEVKVNGEVVASADSDVSKDKLYDTKKDAVTIENTSANSSEDKVTELAFTIDTSKGLNADENGAYVLEVTKIIDNAGNYVENPTAKTVYVDRTAPQIVKFDFAAARTLKGADNTPVAITDNYGFFFIQDAIVTISAEDKAYKNEVAVGVKGIRVYLRDEDAKTYYSLGELEDGAYSLATITSIDQAKVASTDKEIKVTIPANFKGQIFAYAIDNLNNDPTNNKVFDDSYNMNQQTGYATPDAAVVESTEKHADEAHISIVPNVDPVYTMKDTYVSGESTAETQTSNVELYDKNVTYDLVISDTYSGIRSAGYVLTAPFDSGAEVQTSDCEVGYKGSFVKNETPEGKDKPVWSITKEKSKNNLVHEITASVDVPYDCNDITLEVTMTDNSGNTTTKTVQLSIDKTKPYIEVVASPASASSEAIKSYYNTARTFTVTVRERNADTSKKATFTKFDYNQTDAKALAEGTLLPRFDISTFKTNGKVVTAQKENGEKYEYIEYTKKITIPANHKYEGHYKFFAQVTDLTARFMEADYTNVDRTFTMDITPAVVSVKYSGPSAINTKYFDTKAGGARVATITVKEHNFDPDSNRGAIITVKPSIKKVNGVDTKQPGNPARSSWKQTETDTWVLTLTYKDDGDYTFKFDAKDKAGNVTADSQVSYDNPTVGRSFTIDTQKPIIKIRGVENDKSYTGEVTPKIYIGDTNQKDCTYTLLRYNLDGTKDVTSSFITAKPVNGSTVVEKSFEKIRGNDGLYSLKITVKDAAQHETTKHIVFTVNRFGSTYTRSNDLDEVLGKYYVNKTDGEYIITEYNPNKLNKGSIQVSITNGDNEISPVYKVSDPVLLEAGRADFNHKGWYSYEYRISNDSFKEDGKYTISISSIDSNGTPSKIKDLVFVKDTKLPEIELISGFEKESYYTTAQSLQYSVSDSRGVAKIEFFIMNDKDFKNQIKSKKLDINNLSVKDYRDLFENADQKKTYVDFGENIININAEEITLPASNTAKRIGIIVTDLAGNEYTLLNYVQDNENCFDAITVTSNPIVYWYSTPVLLYSTLGGLAAIAGVVVFLVVRKRKKNAADQETK